MPLTLDHWRRVLAAPPGQMPPDVAQAVMSAFEHYVRNADKGMTLDRAFGAAGPSGGDPWYVKLSRDRRNDAFRELAEMVCNGGSMRQMAAAASREVQRYRPRCSGKIGRAHV